MHVSHPYHLDGRGRTAEADEDAHVRDLIEQVLFTIPGERVNRPTFGSGIGHNVFSGWSEELNAATQYQVRSALLSCLDDLISVEDVDVRHERATLYITLHYVVRSSERRRSAQFTRALP